MASSERKSFEFEGTHIVAKVCVTRQTDIRLRYLLNTIYLLEWMPRVIHYRHFAEAYRNVLSKTIKPFMCNRFFNEFLQLGKFWHENAK